MQSLRAVRRKISAVKNIQKITQAMRIVAANKLRKVQDRVAASRPYAHKMRELLGHVVPHVPAELVEANPLLQARAGHRIGLVLMTSDRGLCGSYNHNVIRLATSFMQQHPEADFELVTIGRKGGDYFAKRGYALTQRFRQITEDSPFSEVQVITQAIVGLYTRPDNPVDEVRIVYTQFLSAMQQRAVVAKFLPIEPPEGTGVEEKVGELEYLFEPEARRLIEILLPRFVDNQVYQYLLEAVASEHAARMTAMTAATDNAGELLENLTLQFNKARQASITKELLEVVSGAEALKG